MCAFCTLIDCAPHFPTLTQGCLKLVMDSSNSDITFDENGFCNYWHDYHAFMETQSRGEDRKRLLEQTIGEIKASGEDKPHDCVLGLSGGVDCSYLALVAKEYGLRPLVIDVDNGWNTELAVKKYRAFC